VLQEVPKRSSSDLNRDGVKQIKAASSSSDPHDLDEGEADGVCIVADAGDVLNRQGYFPLLFAVSAIGISGYAFVPSALPAAQVRRVRVIEAWPLPNASHSATPVTTTQWSATSPVIPSAAWAPVSVSPSRNKYHTPVPA